VDAIKKTNLNYPAGTIAETFYEQLIRTVGEFKSIKEIGNVPVYLEKNSAEKIDYPYKREAVSGFDEPLPSLPGEKEYKKSAQPGSKIVMINDLANVRLGLKPLTSLSRYNGKRTVSLSLYKRADANVVITVNRVKQKLKIITPTLPKNIEYAITYDQSFFIRQAIDNVSSSALQGGILAFLVLVIFLKNLRSALIVAASIPISIMATFAAMYFKGISLNMISLGGLALGVGMLVDGAIVVVENIIRNLELGKNKTDAVIQGCSEVFSAVTSSVITTIIVFLPMVFVGGAAGQIFKELSFTVTVSLLASLIIAFTFIPAFMYSGKNSIRFEPKPQKISHYAVFLTRILNTQKRKVIIRCALLFVAAVFLSFLIDKEFLPAIDQGQFIVKLSLPPGSTLQATNQVAEKIEQYLLTDSSMQTVIVDIGSEKKEENILQTMANHQARIMVTLKPRRPYWALIDWRNNYRRGGSQKIIQRLKQHLAAIDLRGGQVEYILQENILQAAFSQTAPLVIELKGYDLNYLQPQALELKEQISYVRGIYGVKDSLTLPSPETKIIIDKDKAAALGLAVSDIAFAGQTAIEGNISNKFKTEGKEIDIRVRLQQADRNDTLSLRKLLLHSPYGYDLALADVADFQASRGPTEILHDNQERIISIWANISRRSANSAAKEIEQKILPKFKLKPNYSINLSGEYRQMKESFSGLIFALGLSLILVYMVMAAQFENLKQPLLIMFTVPLSVIGIVGGLLISGIKLNIMVFLGAIVLGGVVVNNGIVLIDCINRFVREGFPLKQAIIQAGQTRLRPILLTTVTTLVGLLPLALGLDLGQQLQQPMAITIIFGLAASTFLSLIVLPILYFLTAKQK
jgi:HAE1 family hydrophobic/amphiphilic exporter-1